MTVSDYAHDPDDAGTVTKGEVLTFAFDLRQDLGDITDIRVVVRDGFASSPNPYGATCGGDDVGDPAEATCVHVAVGNRSAAVSWGSGPIIEEVTLGSDNADPTLAREGDAVTLWFRSNIALTENDITLDFRVGDSGNLSGLGSWSAVGGSGGAEWELTYVVPGGEEADNGGVAFELTIRDEDGNEARANEEDTEEVLVDTLAPVTTATVNPSAPDGQDDWYTSRPAVSLACVDGEGEVSGCELTEYGINGDGWTAYTGTPVEIDDEGETVLRFRSTDTAGNTEAPLNLTFNLDTVAPVTTATVGPENPDGQGDWFTSRPSVSLACDDGEGEVSGCDVTEYEINDGDWTTYTGMPVEIDDEGATILRFRSIDEAGNVEAAQQRTFTVDTTPPSIEAEIDDGSGATSGVDAWHRDADGLILRLTFTDATSGLATINAAGPEEPAVACDEVEAGQTTAATCTIDLAGLDDGVHGFTASATDVAGNPHEETFDVQIDATAPETMATVEPPTPPSGFHSEPPTVELECDAGEGDVSGCDLTEYGIGGGAWTPYEDGEGILIDAEGDTVFSYRSTDDAGNTEEGQELVIRLDTTSPAIAVVFDDGPGAVAGWHSDPSGLALEFTFTDDGSGLATIGVAGPVDAGCDAFQDGAASASCTPELSGLQDGIHGFTASATDVAGNQHGETFDVQIDATASVTTAIVDPETPPSGFHSEPPSVALTCDDGEEGMVSGCDLTEYRIDGGEWTTYIGTSIQIDAEGVTILQFRSTDVAGNVEEVQEETFDVDTLAPATTAMVDPSVPDGPDDWHTSGPTVTLACSDGEGEVSGCGLTEYHFGDGAWQEYDEAVGMPDGAGVVLWFRSTDVAGNVEETRDTAPIDVDTTPPQGNVLLDALDDPHRGETVPVGFEASDAASGVASVQLLVQVPDGDGFVGHGEAVAFDPPRDLVSDQAPDQDPIVYAPDISGFHSFKILVTDAAGHEWTSAAAGVEVVLPPGDASVSHSLITAESSQIIADGEDATIITVVLRDARQTPLEEGGAGLVCLATDAGALASVAAQGLCGAGQVQADDGNDGSYSATLTAGTALETATVSGSLDGEPIADTAVVGFVAGPATSLVFVSDDSPIASGDARVLAVELQDADGRPAAGTVVFTQTDGSGSLTGLEAPGAAVEAVDGVAALTVTGLDAGGVAVEASMDGLVATASLEVVAGEPTQVLAAATEDGAVADGVEENVLRVVLRDLNGNPVPDAEVWVGDDDGMIFHPSVAVTDAAGEALFAAASTVSGAFTAAFASSAGSGEATVVFVPGPMEASKSVIHAGAASLVAGGGDSTDIVVVASDAHGNPVGQGGAGLVVCLATDAGTLGSAAGQGGCLEGEIRADDMGDGFYWATLTAAEAVGRATVSGVLDGVAFPAVAVVDFVTKKQSFGAHPPPSGDAGEDATDTTTDSDADTTTGGGADPAASGDISAGPTVTVSPSRAPDVGSWYTSPVGFTASAGSEGAVCDTPRVHSGPDGRGLVVAMACTDEEGSGSGSLTFDYDGLPPTVSVSAPALVGADGGQAVFHVEDLASGVASWDAQYRVDGGVWLPLPGQGASRALPDAPDGSVVDVRAGAVDHAGHERVFPDDPDASVRVALGPEKSVQEALGGQSVPVEARADAGGVRVAWSAMDASQAAGVQVWRVAQDGHRSLVATLGKDDEAFQGASYLDAEGGPAYAVTVFHEDGLGLYSESGPPSLDAIHVGVVPAGLDDAGQAGSAALVLGVLGALALLVLAAAATLVVALLRRKVPAGPRR